MKIEFVTRYNSHLRKSKPIGKFMIFTDYFFKFIYVLHLF